MRLAGRSALVTGASRGIGAAIARRFAAEGARVCLAARSLEDCERIADSIRESGGEATAVACDVTRPESYERAIAAAAGNGGKIDVLVNNAGTSGWTPVDGGTSAEDSVWDAIVATNLTAAFRVTREAVRFMPDGGRVI
ncbi:MAG TPA: SDR family NAD(P)-dependent oxidoreductase, partial [Thermoanaerobaculia bacterium]|nr:SDR family NAD(P)-dependent oxidoreductase [Thermoanaerobaculia bacterium]